MEPVTPAQAPDAAPTSSQQASAPAEDTLPPLSATPLDALEAHFDGSQPINLGEGVVTPPSEQPAATPTAEQPTGQVTTPPATPPAEDERPNRISTSQFNDSDWAAIRALRDMRAENPNATMRDALDLVAAKATPATTATVTPPADPGPSEVQQLEQQLAELDAQLDDHADPEKGEQRFDKDVLAKIRQRGDLERQLFEARGRESTAVEAAKSKVLTGRESARAEAIELFPSVADANSRLSKRVASLVAEMKNPDHPDHQTLFTVSAPKAITQAAAELEAREIAKEQGISVGAALASLMADGSVTTPTTETRRVTPAPGSAAITPQPPAPTTQELLASPKGFDVGALDAAYEAKYGRSKSFVIGL